MTDLQKLQIPKIYNKETLSDHNKTQQTRSHNSMIKISSRCNPNNLSIIRQSLIECQISVPDREHPSPYCYLSKQQNNNLPWSAFSTPTKLLPVIIVLLALLVLPVQSIEIKTLQQLQQQYLSKRQNLYFLTKRQYIASVEKQYTQFLQGREQYNKNIVNEGLNELRPSDISDIQQEYDVLPVWLQEKWNEELFNSTFQQLSKNIPISLNYTYKFHVFIYPYRIYQIIDQSSPVLDQAIGSIKNDLPKYRQKFQDEFKIPAESLPDQKNQIPSIQPQLPTTNSTNYAIFILNKIKICTTLETCKLLTHLPDKIIIKPKQSDTELKLFKISQSDFIIQKLSKLNIKQTKIISVWHFNLNINNYLRIFGLKNIQQTNTLLHQKLFLTNQIKKTQQSISVWDTLHNGSALRFIMITKTKMPNLRQLKQHVARHEKYNEEETTMVRNIQNQPNNRIKIPNVLVELVEIQKLVKLIMAYHNVTKDQIQSIITYQSPSQPSSQNYTWYTNNMTIFQTGINQNQTYTILYYTREYSESFQPSPTPTVTKTSNMEFHTELSIQQQNNNTSYRQLLALDQQGNFYLIFNNKINSTTNYLKIFKNTVNQLQYVQQFSVSNNYNKNNFHVMHIREDKSYLAYYKQQQMVETQNNNKSSQIKISYYIIMRSINNKKTLLTKILSQNTIHETCRYSISTEYLDQNQNSTPITNFQIHEINKIGEEYLSICYKTNKISDDNQLLCTIIHATCQEVYRFVISQVHFNNYFNTKYHGYLLKWQFLENQLYNYDQSIKLSIASNDRIDSTKAKQEIQQISNNIQQVENYTYLKILINREKLLEQSRNGSRSLLQQQKSRSWLYQDNNSIYYGIKYNISNLTQQNINKIRITNEQEEDFVQQQQNIKFCINNNNETIQQQSLSASLLNNTNNITNSIFDISFPFQKPSISPTTALYILHSQNQSISPFPRQSCSKIQSIQQGLYFPIEYYTEQNKNKYLQMYGIKLLQSKLKKLLKSKWVETGEQQSSNCQLLWKSQLHKENNVVNANNSENKQQNNKSSEEQQHQMTEVEDNSKNQFMRIVFGSSRKSKTNHLDQLQKNNTNDTIQNNWKICRIIINTNTSQNFLIQPQLSSTTINNPKIATPIIHNPYHIYRCSFKNSTTLSKCNYEQWSATQQSKQVLPQNSKSILFIINEGQTYNLLIKKPQQFNKTLFIISFAGWLIACKHLCVYGCTYFGLINTNTQPVFRYPLNYFELKLKMKRMIVHKLCKQTRYKKSGLHPTAGSLPQLHHPDDEPDDCIFCLQQKKIGQKMIELYCQHIYHKQCLQQWVKQQNNVLSCPICKRKLNADSLRRYQIQMERIGNVKMGESQVQIIL